MNNAELDDYMLRTYRTKHVETVTDGESSAVRIYSDGNHKLLVYRGVVYSFHENLSGGNSDGR